jgi:hypothetical protein
MDANETKKGDNKMQVAKTILEQLGGNQFVVMTGSKNFVGSETGLSFKVGRNSKGVTHVRINLNAMDTYDVEFLKVRKLNPQVAAYREGIYFDQLQALFTAETGLYTHL